MPELCIVKFNARTAIPDDESWLMTRLDALLAALNARDGIRAELLGGFTRPPKVFDAAHEKLAAMLKDCGQNLGIDMHFKPTGGCCDGNNLAAAGLPNIDNLGLVGANIHSDREYMVIPSLAERARLSALLLMRLASGHYAP